MTKYIALDDGHGIGTPGKRTPAIPELDGRVIQENEFNREVVKFLDEELKRNGFKTLLTAPTDDDTPLSTRVQAANNAKVDLFISIHFNALDGKFDGEGKDPEGFSAHVYLTNAAKESGKFAKIALKHLAEGTEQKNRGLVEQDLYVTRVTSMPAVLFELGFMDNKREAMLMINVDFQKECAREIAKAVCEYYGVTYKGETVVEAPKPAPTPAPEVPKPAPALSEDTSLAGKRVESIYGGSDGLNFYSKPTWDKAYKVGTFAKGMGWTIVSKIVVDGSPMYKVKNSKGAIYYITASTTYVKVEGATSAPAPKPAPQPSGIKQVGTIKIDNLNNFTYIYSKTSDKSTRLGEAHKGKTFPISGSVPGWWEIIYNGKRAYVKDKYGRRV